jgi:hypothetical protein
MNSVDECVLRVGLQVIQRHIQSRSF